MSEEEVTKDDLEDGRALLRSELESCTSELARTQKELDEARSRLTVVECVKEENVLELEREKEALTLEIQTLKALLTESLEENARIRGELENKAAILGGAAMISDVTKTFARKVKNNLQTVIPKESFKNLEGGGGETLKSISSSSSSSSSAEDEVAVLKDKLRETDTILQETEERHAKAILGVDSLAACLKGLELDKTFNIESLPNGNNVHDALMSVRYGLLLMERNELKELLKKEREVSSKCNDSSIGLNNRTNELNSAGDNLKEVSAGEAESISSSGPNGVVKEVGNNNLTPSFIDSTQIEESKKLVEKYKEELRNESVFRKEVEAKWNDASEKYKSDTEVLSGKVKNLESLLEQLRDSYSKIYEASRKDLHSLTKDREKIVREIKRLQDENDKLVGKHSLKAEEFQNLLIDLPDKIEDIHTLLLKYREELISAKIAKETLEDKLKDEVGFLKTQIVNEQRTKENLEETLTREIDSLKENIHFLESYKTEFEAERKRRQEYETKYADYKELKKANEKLHNDTNEFQSRVANLQTELDNSVAVQTDFVRLSQSLQIELEKIRQSEKEVRWQHEDDVDACSNCKNAFGVTKRKHHCRHCGRVFCADCVSKNVQAGPSRRNAKVCDVCHTLLVSDSAPYFSSEASNKT